MQAYEKSYIRILCRFRSVPTAICHQTAKYTFRLLHNLNLISRGSVVIYFERVQCFCTHETRIHLSPVWVYLGFYLKIHGLIKLTEPLGCCRPVPWHATTGVMTEIVSSQMIGSVVLRCSLECVCKWGEHPQNCFFCLALYDKPWDLMDTLIYSMFRHINCPDFWCFLSKHDLLGCASAIRLSWEDASMQNFGRDIHTGWWFGTWLSFSHILRIIIPID